MSEPTRDAPEAQAPSAPSTSLLFDVFALNQAVGRLLAAAMRDGPLTPNEYAVYSAVFELESATPTQLAGRLGMRLTTFMDQLRLLEARGHARRVDHPSDRRSYRVVLTSSGLAAHREANVRFERAFLAISSHLPHGEPAAKAGLDVVRRAADAALVDLATRVEGSAADSIPATGPTPATTPTPEGAPTSAERPTPLQPAGRAG